MKAEIRVVEVFDAKAIEVYLDKANDELMKKLLFRRDDEILSKDKARYILDSATIDRIQEKTHKNFDQILSIIVKQLEKTGYKIKHLQNGGGD